MTRNSKAIFVCLFSRPASYFFPSAIIAQQSNFQTSFLAPAAIRVLIRLSQRHCGHDRPTPNICPILTELAKDNKADSRSPFNPPLQIF